MQPIVDFLTQPIVLVLLAAALGGAGVALGTHFLPLLKAKKQGYAYEEEIEAAILPVVYQAIASAYKMSEFAMDELGERLNGAEKQKFALAVYDMLPPRIGRFPVGIFKTLIGPEQFASLVQIAFDQFMTFYNQRHGDYVDLWDQWRAEYEEPQ